METEKGRYLVWRDWWSCTKSLIEISIIEISKTSIKIKFGSGFTEWVTKENFKATYKIHEKLSGIQRLKYYLTKS